MGEPETTDRTWEQIQDDLTIGGHHPTKEHA